jgi:hypothetical protein
MGDPVVAGLAVGRAAATEESEFTLIGGTREFKRFLGPGKAGLLLCMLLLTACASDAGNFVPQRFGACDRNGGEEDRRACLP